MLISLGGKAMDASLEKSFFDSFYNGLKNEDEILRRLCEQNAPRYDGQHNGISFLYETTMVYVVLKQLMKDEFPLTVDWEHPYPCNSALKADIGLLDAEKQVDSLVEFKIWTSEYGKEVKHDVDKFKSCNSNCDKYLCLIEISGGNIEDNAEFLVKENPDVELLYKNSFDSLFKKYGEMLQLVSTHLYMLKMK